VTSTGTVEAFSVTLAVNSKGANSLPSMVPTK
jgi:hypothetical protein